MLFVLSGHWEVFSELWSLPYFLINDLIEYGVDVTEDCALPPFQLNTISAAVTTWTASPRWLEAMAATWTVCLRDLTCLSCSANWVWANTQTYSNSKRFVFAGETPRCSQHVFQQFFCLLAKATEKSHFVTGFLWAVLSELYHVSFSFQIASLDVSLLSYIFDL